MATPITFSVPAARRSGTFQTAPMTLPAGYTLLQWSLDIPKVAEYEDPSVGFTAEVHSTPPGGIDGVYGSGTWAGGRVVLKGVTDPVPMFGFGLENVPVGSSVYVKILLTGTFTVGISGGVLS